MMTFKHLARFEHQGQIHYGELVESNGNDFTVQKLSGDLTAGFNATGQTVSVRRARQSGLPESLVFANLRQI